MLCSRFVKRFFAPAFLAALVGLASAPGNAEAGLVSANGTFVYTPIGNVTYTGASLSVASSITLPALEIITSAPTPYLGKPNDFVGLPGTFAALNPLTLHPGASGLNPGYLAFGPADNYVYNMTSITWTHSSANDLSFQSLGTFHDASGTTFLDGPASLSGSFTQTLGTGAVGAIFSFETPPTPTPEPGSLVVMLGAFAGLGLFGRFRRKEKALGEEVSE